MIASVTYKNKTWSPPTRPNSSLYLCKASWTYNIFVLLQKEIWYWGRNLRHSLPFPIYVGELPCYQEWFLFESNYLPCLPFSFLSFCALSWRTEGKVQFQLWAKVEYLPYAGWKNANSSTGYEPYGGQDTKANRSVWPCKSGLRVIHCKWTQSPS